MTTNEQLELGFNGKQARVFGKRRETKMARSQWWFAKMREVVAGAMDWQVETPSRPEQILFAGVNRQLKV
jgi:hypothetical protein